MKKGLNVRKKRKMPIRANARMYKTTQAILLRYKTWKTIITTWGTACIWLQTRNEHQRKCKSGYGGKQNLVVAQVVFVETQITGQCEGQCPALSQMAERPNAQSNQRFVSFDFYLKIVRLPATPWIGRKWYGKRIPEIPFNVEGGCKKQQTDQYPHRLFAYLCGKIKKISLLHREEYNINQPMSTDWCKAIRAKSRPLF